MKKMNEKIEADERVRKVQEFKKEQHLFKNQINYQKNQLKNATSLDHKNQIQASIENLTKEKQESLWKNMNCRLAVKSF